MNKHISTAAAAIALVSAISLAYAQTSDPAQPVAPDANAPAVVQQQDAQQAVKEGTTATPDWRTPDYGSTNAAPVAVAPAPAPMAAPEPDPTPAPMADTTAAPVTDNSTPAADTTTTTDSAPMITERAPQADRN